MRPPSSDRVVPVAFALLVLLTSCTRTSDDAVSTASTTTVPGTATTTVAVSDDGDTDGSGPVTDGTRPAAGGTTSAPATTVPVVTAPPVSVVELAEVGVPGLDSTDAFCAAWSRFAGSFQVVAVTAAFGSGPPGQVASLEVAASPVVTDAYDALFENWPEDMAAERELVADEFLGPFARRLSSARESLDAVGADDATVATISDAWVAGLAGRDPSTPEFTVDLPDETWSVIDAAAADFADRLVPFTQDPSLVTEAQTPLTDRYLAVSCPDQGTLSGQEIDSP